MTSGAAKGDHAPTTSTSLRAWNQHLSFRGSLSDTTVFSEKRNAYRNLSETQTGKVCQSSSITPPRARCHRKSRRQPHNTLPKDAKSAAAAGCVYSSTRAELDLDMDMTITVPAREDRFSIHAFGFPTDTPAMDPVGSIGQGPLHCAQRTSRTVDVVTDKYVCAVQHLSLIQPPRSSTAISKENGATGTSLL